MPPHGYRMSRTALADALREDGRAFNGAYVPLVIHDPQLAERSYDAAEWAADLIRGPPVGGGMCHRAVRREGLGWPRHPTEPSAVEPRRGDDRASR